MTVCGNMFLEKVRKYIVDHSLCATTSPILVGLSGGPDSVALLCALKELGYSCIAAHCNFHLRGEESDRDMEFSRNLAEKMQIPFKLVHFNTKTYAENNRISIEMAARDLRYDWFSKLKSETGASSIAVAHHSDDVVETFFINLMRGSGLHGLTGIKPKNGDIVRPLLGVSRLEILDYLKEKGQNYIVDSTNNENDFLRNKLRNIIIPEMESAVPTVKKSVLRTIDNLLRSEQLQNETIQTWEGNTVSQKNHIVYIKLEELQSQTNREMLLFELLRPYNGTIDIVRSVFRSGEDSSGLKYPTQTHLIVKNRNELQISVLEQEETAIYKEIGPETDCIYTPLQLTFKLLDKKDVCLKKDSKHCYVDVDKLTYPLHIRNWEKGDSFVPFGQTGTKKLSDFFINEKMSLLEKEQCFILTNGDGKIVWIIGRRSDNRFRITDKTKKVLHIRL